MLAVIYHVAECDWSDECYYGELHKIAPDGERGDFFDSGDCFPTPEEAIRNIQQRASRAGGVVKGFVREEHPDNVLTGNRNEEDRESTHRTNNCRSQY